MQLCFLSLLIIFFSTGPAPSSSSLILLLPVCIYYARLLPQTKATPAPPHHTTLAAAAAAPAATLLLQHRTSFALPSCFRPLPPYKHTHTLVCECVRDILPRLLSENLSGENISRFPLSIGDFGFGAPEGQRLSCACAVLSRRIFAQPHFLCIFGPAAQQPCGSSRLPTA